MPPNDQLMVLIEGFRAIQEDEVAAEIVRAALEETVRELGNAARRKNERDRAFCYELVADCLLWTPVSVLTAERIDVVAQGLALAGAGSCDLATLREIRRKFVLAGINVIPAIAIE